MRKGKPSVTQYSYAVSMAVAISSRRIGSVRRIWADGNLLRGAAGDLKARCTYRLYNGGADQAVDPLMASALGLGAASAHRDMAYAVFENLDLTDFGNRIPSLTFEVVGDDVAVSVGALVGDMMGDTSRGDGAALLAGYAASGRRVGDAIAPLADAYGLRMAGDASGWRLAAPTSGATLAMADFAATPLLGGAAQQNERQRGALADVPGRIRLRHYDPARDYLAGQQTAVVAGGGRGEGAVDLPAALSATAAQSLAASVAARALDGRETVTTRGDFAALALPLGAFVDRIDGEATATGGWILSGRRLSGDGMALEWTRRDGGVAPTSDAGGGVAVLPPDWGPSTGYAHLIDVPPFGDTPLTASAHVLAVAGSNAGWRGARVWRKDSAESEPVPVGVARPVSAMGVLVAPLGIGAAGVFNRQLVFEVELVDPAMALVNADEGALLAGANRAMVGDEVVQFGEAESLGAGRWRLGQLLRGVAGTEDDIMLHAVGTPFVLLDGDALFPVAASGQVFADGSQIEWAGLIDDSVTVIPVGGPGRALRPLSPVHLLAQRNTDGSVAITWIRRSRNGWAWRDMVDAPLGELDESYELTVAATNGDAQSYSIAAPGLALSQSDFAALGGMGPYLVSVRQTGQFGVSPATVTSFS